MEAAEFVHSKHLAGENTDGFAEYLGVSHQMLKDKIKEKSN